MLKKLSTSVPASGGIQAQMLRHDWAATPMGPPERWPGALHHALDLMQGSAEAMCLVWGDASAFFFNDAFAPILGRRADDALGRSLPVVFPAAWDAVRGPLSEALADRPQRFKDVPLVLTRRGVKEKTWWSYSFSRLHDDAGLNAGVLCVAQETTEHVQSAIALSESEQRLDALIRSSSEVRFSMSADWGKLYELKGGKFISDTEATNANWLEDYIPADARDAVRAEFERAIRTRSTYLIEHPVNRVDGSVGWAQVRAVPLIDATGVITGWLGAASDITDRKRAEAALKESERRLRDLNATLEDQVIERTEKLRLFRDVIEASAAPTCVFDAAYRQVAFNPSHAIAFKQLFGLEMKGGEVLPDMLPAEQAVQLRDNMARALSGESFQVAVELGAVAEALRGYELLFTPLRNESGSVIGGFYFAHDITDRLRAQIELESTHSALRQAQKLEAVGQLTGGVAHDFNNFLTVIKSSSDMLQRPDLPPHRRSRLIEMIADTADRAARLTGQLLAFAGRQTLQPEVFAACDSIRSLKDMFGTLAGDQIRLVTDLPATPCCIYADADQFDTAVVNMAVNSRDAIDGVGEIVIRVEPADSLPAARLHSAVQGQYVAVSITDTGCGIAPDKLDAVFEPFFTTKEVGKGTGLGLSQVFGFAKQSGGEIHVTSQLGKGTTFTLYLPRVAGSPKEDTPPTQLEPLADGHGSRVLVVEDSADVGASCVSALIGLGYRPTLVTCAEEALAQLQNGQVRFDVIFSDVLMPGMNGIELGKAIRKLYPLLPVVLTSGYSAVLAEQGSYGFELVLKPYSLDQLSRALTKAIRNTPQLR